MLTCGGVLERNWGETHNEWVIAPAVFVRSIDQGRSFMKWQQRKAYAVLHVTQRVGIFVIECSLYVQTSPDLTP